MAVQKLLGVGVFLRHGETEYTNVFPDLLPEGMHTIDRSAQEIGVLHGKFPDWALKVVTSPAIRAKGSAAVIVSKLKTQEAPLEMPAIKEAQVRDLARGKAIFGEHMALGNTNLSVMYGRDGRYEDPTIFEPRSEVQARFYNYLARLARNFTATGPCLVAHVSHYEFLYHFVEEIFRLDYSKAHPLAHGELIVVSFYSTHSAGMVKLHILFRGMEVGNVFFDCAQGCIF